MRNLYVSLFTSLQATANPVTLQDSNLNNDELKFYVLKARAAESRGLFAVLNTFQSKKWQDRDSPCWITRDNYRNCHCYYIRQLP